MKVKLSIPVHLPDWSSGRRVSILKSGNDWKFVSVPRSSRTFGPGIYELERVEIRSTVLWVIKGTQCGMQLVGWDVWSMEKFYKNDSGEGVPPVTFLKE